ncbi:MAG: F0F1 ATP synthase subunit A [Nitrospiraceae bacterium]|nr:F0F1 ATP synthase subunit A [Nitrospiraceae bacterium]
MRPLVISPEPLIRLGPVIITKTVATTWLIMAVITLVCWFAKRHLALKKPSRLQEALEAVLEAVENMVKDVLPDVDPWLVIPVIGTLWILIGVSNLAGLIPGLKTPTADINTTFAFAVLSYSMTHFFGIKTRGLKGYVSHYVKPSWVLLPFHLIAETTRTMALAVRLFGNMLSGEMTAAIVLGIAGLLVPVPFALLHIIIGLIQAYIFGVLTLVFIAGGIQKEA